eukprot:PhF_6_TR19621/c0_g1_i1/m.28632
MPSEISAMLCRVCSCTRLFHQKFNPARLLKVISITQRGYIKNALPWQNDGKVTSSNNICFKKVSLVLRGFTTKRSCVGRRRPGWYPMTSLANIPKQLSTWLCLPSWSFMFIF